MIDIADGETHTTTFAVVIDTEYLPDRRILGVTLSPEFSSEEVAELSRRQLVKIHPDCRVRASTWHDADPNDDYYQRAVRLDAYLRDQYPDEIAEITAYFKVHGDFLTRRMKRAEANAPAVA